MDTKLYIGIDIGTSGVRALAIDAAGTEHARHDVRLPAPRVDGAAVEQEPAVWWQGVREAIEGLCGRIDPQSVQAVAVDGTSGTVFLADAAGHPLSPGLMYNDGRAVAEADHIAAGAPRESAAHGTASGLAKLLWLLPRCAPAARVHSQADWVTGLLLGRFGRADANNVLKLGWDPVGRRWPAWLGELGVGPELLPAVVEPGTVLGPIDPALAAALGLPGTVRITAGTTDSTAAFIATGAAAPGEAVTSLGSTLVTKVVSERPVFAPEYGVYSQPLGRRWLVGGGSNSGGAVLRRFFDDARMAKMTPLLHPETPTGLDFYPLNAPGERFPVNDPNLAPRLEPRPADDVVFFQGLLEGMAAIEQRAYRLLADLGAPYPTSVCSAGGGAHNPAWCRIRERLLGVPVSVPNHTDAAYGSALLARG